MSVQRHLRRALRYAAVALCLATGFEVLEHFIFRNLSAGQFHILRIMLCTSVVFLLTSVGLLRERRRPQQLSEPDQRLHGSGGLWRAQDATAESERRYRLLFENMLEGFAYCEMLFDDRGRAVDFVYLAVNSAFEKLTGLEDVVGKRFTAVVPEGSDAQPELFERYGRVVSTGEPERFEIEIEALGRWFSISAYGAEKGCFVATFSNITERKQAE